MISSPHNARVARAARLRRRSDRESERRFLVEGPQAVDEALTVGAPVAEVFHVPGADRTDGLAARAAGLGIPVHAVSPGVMGRLASARSPQGIVAVAGFVDVPLEALPAAATCVPVLFEVADPGNAGTIVRSADAAGADAVVLSTGSVDVYNAKTVRASAGSLFHLPVVREVAVEAALDALRQRGLSVVALAAGAPATLDEVGLSSPTALLFGNEAHGLPERVAAMADIRARVPMRGRAESLNLAAAAAVTLFEAARRRDGAGDPGLAAFAGLVREGVHDARTPAAALRGFASLLRSRWDRLDDARRLEIVAAIEADAARVSDLLVRLHEAARLAGGAATVGSGRVDVAEVAGGLAGDLDGTPVEVAGSTAVIVRGDRERLAVLVAALVDAARWWGASGPVRLAVTADPGPAIEAVRAGGATGEGPLDVEATGGAGANRLAVYVARGMARAHGGELEASGTADGGVRFLVRLPPAPEPAAGAPSS